MADGRYITKFASRVWAKCGCGGSSLPLLQIHPGLIFITILPGNAKHLRHRDSRIQSKIFISWYFTVLVATPTITVAAPLFVNATSQQTGPTNTIYEPGREGDALGADRDEHMEFTYGSVQYERPYDTSRPSRTRCCCDHQGRGYSEKKRQ
jgi:hypothetical protein